MKRQVPNLITLARLVLAVVVFVCLDAMLSAPAGAPAMRKAADWAFWLFLVAAVTDFVDGYLARKYGWVTALGRIGDSVVDKVLIIGTMAYLAAGCATAPVGAGHFGVEGDWMRVMPVWALVLSITREFLITALRGLVEAAGMQFPADKFGKWKFTLQVVYISAALGGPSVLAEGGALEVFAFTREPWFLVPVFWTMLGLTVFSGVQYVTRGTRMLSGKES